MLLPENTERCPNCENSNKTVKIEAYETVTVTDHFSWQTIREYYEKNSVANVAVILITLVSAIVGVFVTGVWGILLGLILGLIGYVLSPLAVTKVREIRKG